MMKYNGIENIYKLVNNKLCRLKIIFLLTIHRKFCKLKIEMRMTGQGELYA